MTGGQSGSSSSIHLFISTVLFIVHIGTVFCFFLFFLLAFFFCFVWFFFCSCCQLKKPVYFLLSILFCFFSHHCHLHKRTFFFFSSVGPRKSETNWLVSCSLITKLPIVTQYHFVEILLLIIYVCETVLVAMIIYSCS